MNRLLSHVGPPLRALQAVLRNGRITRMQLAFLLFNVAEPAMWVAIFVYAFDQGATPEVGYVLAAIAAITYTTGRPNHHALMPLLSESPEQVAAANSVSSLSE